MRLDKKLHQWSDRFDNTSHRLEISFRLVSPKIKNKLRTLFWWDQSQSYSYCLTSCPFQDNPTYIVCHISGCHSRAVTSLDRTCSTRHNKCRTSYWLTRRDLALLCTLLFSIPNLRNPLSSLVEHMTLLGLDQEESCDRSLCRGD